MFGRRFLFIAAAFFAACSPHGSQSVVPAAGAPNHGAFAPAQSSPVPYGPVKFKYTGQPETYVVPEGVTSLSVTLYGGKSNSNPGGVTQATIPVKPGEVLTVNIGGDGGAPTDAKHGGAGGYNGGGNGAAARCCFARDAAAGYGGGGATSVQHADGRWAVVAGGAGGGSGDNQSGGAGGGMTGQTGSASQYGLGGAGGTQDCDHSQIGAGAAGRSGANSAYGGGGGGAGYCGGDGGSGSSSHAGSDVGDAGGGGGSGHFEHGATSATTASQDPNNAHNASVLIVPPPKLVTMVSGLNLPWGVAVDAAGNVYVADTGNKAVKKFAPDGSLLKTYTGFQQPEGVAVGPNGSVYVADFKGETLTKIATNGTKTTLDSGRNFESVAVLSNGAVYVTDRGYSKAAFANYWELYKLGDKLDIYWDWATGSAPHEIGVQNSCTNPYQPCYIYTTIAVDQGKGKSPKYEVWAITYSGTHSAVSNINITPNAGLAYNGVTLWVASGLSNAVCGLNSGVCSRVGNFWQSPQGLAVTPSCTTLCTLYIVDQADGVVKKLVP